MVGWPLTLCDVVWLSSCCVYNKCSNTSSLLLSPSFLTEKKAMLYLQWKKATICLQFAILIYFYLVVPWPTLFIFCLFWPYKCLSTSCLCRWFIWIYRFHGNWPAWFYYKDSKESQVSTLVAFLITCVTP